MSTETSILMSLSENNSYFARSLFESAEKTPVKYIYKAFVSSDETLLVKHPKHHFEQFSHAWVSVSHEYLSKKFVNGKKYIATYGEIVGSCYNQSTSIRFDISTIEDWKIMKSCDVEKFLLIESLNTLNKTN